MAEDKNSMIEVNHNLNDSFLFIIRKDNASTGEPWADTFFGRRRYEFTKYQIKETDMRVKTATFTSPHYFDLTTGQFWCLIVSPYHENFSGILLKVEYDESTGLYNYQCQDLTRLYFNTMVSVSGTTQTTKTTTDGDKETTEVTYTFNPDISNSEYEMIMHIAARGHLTMPITEKKKIQQRKRLSGIRPLRYYDYGYQGSVVKGNPLDVKTPMIIRNKKMIEVVRSFCYAGGGDIDVYVNKHGVLQVVPTMDYGSTDDEVRIDPRQLSSLKFTFDTTDVVTGGYVDSSDKLKTGTMYNASDVIGINLSAIFGDMGVYISNPNQNSTSVASTTTTTTSSSNTNGNPFNNKAKKAWVDADNGSGSFKSNFIAELKKKGWTVKDGGTGPNKHYEDYKKVTSDYSVLVNIYNGFCACTIREAYSSDIQNLLKNKGVQLVIIFETGTWTNPQGMKPYKYGDFNGYHARRAWDDNFCPFNPEIKNVGTYLKDNKAVYCCNPTVSGVMEQFLAGGYFKWKK